MAGGVRRSGAPREYDVVCVCVFVFEWMRVRARARAREQRSYMRIVVRTAALPTSRERAARPMNTFWKATRLGSVRVTYLSEPVRDRPSWTRAHAHTHSICRRRNNCILFLSLIRRPHHPPSSLNTTPHKIRWPYSSACSSAGSDDVGTAVEGSGWRVVPVVVLFTSSSGWWWGHGVAACLLQWCSAVWRGKYVTQDKNGVYARARRATVKKYAHTRVIIIYYNASDA